MPAAWRTFTHAARHWSSVPYTRSNAASVSPRMIARIRFLARQRRVYARSLKGTRTGRLVDKRVVGSVIVGNQMQVEVLRRLGLDPADELEPFLMAMPLHALSDHLTGRDIQLVRA